MKPAARLLPAVAAALLLFSLPAGAGTGALGQQTGSAPAAQKDECLIVARNCTAESLGDRVDRLEREIARGSGVYSDQELDRMKQQLREFSRLEQINDNHFPPVPVVL